MIRFCSTRPDVWLDGETLQTPGGIVTGADLIDLCLLGRVVPIFKNGAVCGMASREGNLIHLSSDAGFHVLAYKCLRALMTGDAGTVRAQYLPRGD